MYIWSYETQQIVKTFELTDVPVRAGRFIARKNWIVCGSDDLYGNPFSLRPGRRAEELTPGP